MACVWTWAEIGTIFVAGGGDRGARAPGGAGGAVSAVWRRRETVSLLGSAGAGARAVRAARVSAESGAAGALLGRGDEAACVGGWVRSSVDERQVWAWSRTAGV